MNTSHKLTAIFLLGSLAIVGCTPGSGPKQTVGSLLGGAGGAFAGSQFGNGSGRLLGVAIGTLAGSYFGSHLGAKLDAVDRQLARQSMQHTLEKMPDHKTSSWKNPNNQHHGQFTVIQTEELPESHLVCRQYRHRVFMGPPEENPREETVTGKACRDVRDSQAEWKVVN